MAKPNYSFEKRQRELAKQKKQEEKRLKKQHATPDEEVAPDDGDANDSQPPKAD